MITFDDVYNHIMTCDVDDILLYRNRPCADTIWINIFYIGDSGELLVRYDRYMIMFRGFNTKGMDTTYREVNEILNSSQEFEVLSDVLKERMTDFVRLMSL